MSNFASPSEFAYLSKALTSVRAERIKFEGALSTGRRGGDLVTSWARVFLKGAESFRVYNLISDYDLLGLILVKKIRSRSMSSGSGIAFSNKEVYPTGNVKEIKLLIKVLTIENRSIVNDLITPVCSKTVKLSPFDFENELHRRLCYHDTTWAQFDPWANIVRDSFPEMQAKIKKVELAARAATFIAAMSIFRSVLFERGCKK